MKQTVQQQKRKAPAPAMQKPRKTTRLRPGIVNQSNHSRLANDKWERQADEAATRILRGEQNVVRHLSPAPAARPLHTSSRAEPLPREIRTRLEKGFNADLGAVRIHQDQAAREVAEREGANALASGAHIYFRHSHSDWLSTSSFALLSHEVSHTLQQSLTGSPGSRVRVTDRHGTGYLQLDPTLDRILAAYDAERENMDEAERRDLDIARTNIRGATAEPGASETAADISRNMGTLRSQIRAGAFDSRGVYARALLFDAMKYLAHNREAVHFLRQDRSMMSFLSIPNDYPEDLGNQLDRFHTHLYTNHANWLELLLLRDEQFRNFPFYTLQDLWRYLTIPDATFGPARGYRTEHAAFNRENQASLNAQPQSSFLKKNELYSTAWDYLFAWESEVVRAIRQLETNTLENEARPTGLMDLANLKLGMAGELSVRADQALNSDQRFGRAMFTHINRLATDAHRFWRDFEALTLRARDETMTPEDQMPQTREFRRILTSVKNKAEALLFNRPVAQGQPAVHSHARYMQIRDEFVTLLDQHIAGLLQRQRVRFRYVHRDRRGQRNEALWRMLLARWFGSLKTTLNLYQDQPAEGDVTGATLVTEFNIPSRMLVHRLEVSNSLLRIGRRTNYEQIQEALEDVRTAGDIGRSYIAISGSWSEQTFSPHEFRDQFTADMGSNPIGRTGLSGTSIANLYYLKRLDVFNRELLRLLRLHESATTPPDINVLSQAAEHLADQVTLPSKWTVTTAVPVFHGDSESRPTIGALIRGNEIAQNLMQGPGFTANEQIFPEGGANVYIWNLPGFLGLAAGLLRDLETAGLLTEEQRRELAAASDVDSKLALLQRYVLEAGGLEGSLSLSIDNRISGRITRMQECQDYLQRRGSTLQRRNVAHQVKGLIDEYADSPGISNFAKPRQALDKITDYSIRAFPRVRGGNDQLAALILEIAPNINNMLYQEGIILTRRERNFSILNSYFQIIDRALNYIDSDQARVFSVLFTRENYFRREDLEKCRDIDPDMADRQGLQRRLRSIQFERPAQFRSNITELRRARITIRETAEQSRQGSGLEFIAAPLNQYGAMDDYQQFNAGSGADRDDLLVEDQTYVVTRIARSFRFIPAYGSIHTARVESMERDNPVIADGEHLLDYEEDGVRLTIENDAMGLLRLQRLMDVVAIASLIRSLEALGRTIEGAAELTLDLIEFVPGFGQGVMAARMAIQMTQLLRDDLPDIQTQLFDFPGRINDEIKKLVDDGAPGFINTLLFEDFPLEELLLADQEESGGRRRRSRTSRSALTRLFRTVREILETLLRVFIRLKRRIRSTVVNAQSEIQQHRILALVIGALPVLIAIGRDIEGSELAQTLGVDSLDPDVIRENLRTQFIEIVRSIGEEPIEIPNEIIPINLALEAIIGYALGRFGAKGRIARVILEGTGAMRPISVLIGNQITEAGANPNRYWVENFRSQFEEIAGRVQADLYSYLRSTLSSNMGIDIGESGLAPTTVQLNSTIPNVQEETTPEEGPTAEPFTVSGAMIAGSPDTDIDFTGGFQLPPDMRAVLEEDFGHDFSHVRLHQDIKSDQLNRNLGTVALASGSHIFLRTDLSVGSDFGESVLRHELSHVLQQTGDRELSASHGSQPVVGRARGGIRMDPSRETAANHMVQESYSGTVEKVAIQNGGARGLYALEMTGVGLELLRSLSNEELVEEEAQSFDFTVPPRIRRNAGFRRARVDGGNHRNQIRDLFNRGGSSVLSQPYQREGRAVRASIQTLLNNQQRLEAVVFLSLRKLPNNRYELNKRAFIRNLLSYLYAQGGFEIEVGWNASRSQIDTVNLEFIDLANVSARTDIWQKVVNNTRATLTGTHRTRFSERRRRVKNIIDERTHGQPLWHRTEFRLHNDLRDLIKDRLRSAVNIVVDPWNQYIDSDNLGATNGGLRVDRHETLTSATNRRGDRESHHIPQFLLVQYFRNNATTDMLPGNELLPGFSQGRGGLGSFTAGGTTINLAALDGAGSGTRGLGMPAISLAKPTHQKGRLHINAFANWNEADETGAHVTQSVRVDNLFWSSLRSHLRRPASESKEQVIHYANRPENIGTAPGNVHRAMRHTYAEIYREMKNALRTALRDHEIPYYEELAVEQHDDVQNEAELRARHSDYAPIARDRDGIISAVQSKQTTYMSAWE